MFIITKLYISVCYNFYILKKNYWDMGKTFQKSDFGQYLYQQLSPSNSLFVFSNFITPNITSWLHFVFSLWPSLRLPSQLLILFSIFRHFLGEAALHCYFFLFSVIFLVGQPSFGILLIPLLFVFSLTETKNTPQKTPTCRSPRLN